MTVAIMEAAPEVVSIINNLLVVSSLATLILAVNNFALPLKVTNILPSLNRMPYIHHLVQFKKDQAKVQALLDSSSKINTMTLVYMAKLGLKDQSTVIGA